MKFFVRLRLAYQVLTARRARDWRRVVSTCEQIQSDAMWTEILAKQAKHDALNAERDQLLAGTRTTHAAEQILKEVRQLVQPKTKS